MPLSTKVHIGFAAKQTSALDLGSADANLARDYAVSLADGVLAGQANRIFSDSRVLAASATEDLDLAGTALVDVFGAPLTFARVKALVVAALPGNTNNVVVGGAASNAWATWVGAAAHTITLRPGAVIALLAGEADLTAYAVTATTGDLLRVGNGAGGSSVGYEIAIVGAAS